MSRGPERVRWRHLGVGVLGLVAACAVQYGLPYLTIAWRAEGLALAQIGLLVSAPILGLVLTLIAWGGLADRFGERVVMTAGLAAGAAALAGAATASSPVATGLWLVLAGAGTASVHAASGRLVLGWFPEHRRGVAMGVRQTGQPLGVGAAALTLPRLGESGTGAAFAVLAAACGLTAVLIGVLVRDPPRPQAGPAGATASPYRTPVLWRLHAAGGLLVVPQFVVAVFSFEFLVREAAWSAAAAGSLLAAAQVAGAVARLGAGAWSDRVRSRLGPLRRIAGGVAVVVGVLVVVAALTPDVLAPVVAAVAVAVAVVVTVSPNGVAFTSVAEQAGSAWAGRALGGHNTAQHVLATATVPVAALLVDAGAGYATAFGMGALAALAAVPVVPGPAAERPRSRAGVP